MTLAVEPSPRVFRSIWERRLGATESPIEALFLEAFCPAAVENGYAVCKRERIANETIVVTPQKWLDRYRADFLVQFSFFGSQIQIAVECDGHEFHERTKAQAARDRRRDREMQRLGIQVFRFTGSEIRRSPTACAREVLDAIMDFQTETIVRAAERSNQEARP